MTREREDVVGLDATIIMHPSIWKASGHVDTFSDPMSDCLLTRKRFARIMWTLNRASYIAGPAATNAAGKECKDSFSVLLPAGKPPESARRVGAQFYELRGVEAPTLLEESTEKIENSRGFNPENGAQLTEPRPFNLMFKTYVGPTATEADVAYLRPETAQAIFAQFKNVLDSSRTKVPFGICQIGKAFRNEVTPRNFTFRSREFEQMELEFFIAPDEAIRLLHGSVAQWSEDADLSTPQPNWGWEMWHRYWVAQRTAYYQASASGRGAGLPLADAGGTRALCARLRGHPVQVSVWHRRTGGHRRPRRFRSFPASEALGKTAGGFRRRPSRRGRQAGRCQQGRIR